LALKIKPLPPRHTRQTAPRYYCAGAFVEGAFVEGISGAFVEGAEGVEDSSDCF